MSQTAANVNLRQQGLEALKRGQLDLAIRIFTQIVQSNSSDAAAMAALGAAYSQKAMHDKALKLLDRAVRLKPQSPEMHYNRGLALERAGKKLAAGEAYEECLRLKPDHASARQRLAKIEQVLGGGGLPATALEDDGLPLCVPDDDLPSAQLDDEDLPAAQLDDSVPVPATIGQAAVVEDEELEIVAADDIAPPTPREGGPAWPSPAPSPARAPDSSGTPMPPVTPPSRRIGSDKSKATPTPAAPTGPKDAAPTPAVAAPPTEAPRKAPPTMRASPPGQSAPGAAARPKTDPALAVQPTDFDLVYDEPYEVLDVLAAEDEPVTATVLGEQPLEAIPVDEPASAASKSSSRRSAPARVAPLVLAEGETFHSWVRFEVAECEQERLTLRSRMAAAWLWFLGGPFALFLSLGMVYLLITGLAEGSSISGKGIVALIIGLLFAVGVCIIAIAKLFQIGMRLVFDADAQALERKRWFGMMTATWEASDLSALLFRFNDPDDNEQRCTALVIDVNGEETLELGEAKSKDEECDTLLRVSAWASRVLNLPLQIEGTPYRPCQELRDTLAIVSASGWERSTPLKTIPRAEARRAGYVRSTSSFTLGNVAAVFGILIGACFVLMALTMSLFGVFPWVGTFVMTLFVAVAGMLFFSGAAAIREKKTQGTGIWMFTEFRGGTAVLIGVGQIAAGCILLFAMPIVLYVQGDWDKLNNSASVASSPGGDNFRSRNPRPGPSAPPVAPSLSPSEPPRRPRDPLADNLQKLQSTNSQQRREACQYFQGTPRDESRQPEVARLLQGCLTDPDASARTEAARALGFWGSAEDVSNLLLVLNDSDVHVRNAVIQTLAKLKDERAIEPIANLMPDPNHRSHAASALREYGAAAEKMLIRLVKHPDRDTRVEAIRLLERINTGESTAALEEASRDSDARVSLMARSILRRRGITSSTRPGSNPPTTPPGTPMSDTPPPTDSLAKAMEDLKSIDANTRRTACETLARLDVNEEKREEVAIALDKLLTDFDANVKRAAVKALGRWGVKQNVETLVKLLDDGNSFVRRDVFDTLAKLKDERAVDPIAKKLENLFDRPSASKALQEMGPMAEKVVLLGLNSRDQQTRWEVIRILKLIGTKDSNQPLINVSRNRVDPIAARLAQEALDEIGKREREKDKERK